MFVIRPYHRERAVRYAERWATMRNPVFYDFTAIGGNCTNFVSQALYAGSCQMNYTPVFGWYYITPSERTASWTGVDFFYRFITGNRGIGPYGRDVSADATLPGDVVQIGREGEGYFHSMLLVGTDPDGTPLVAAQSEDAYGRRLDTYRYDFIRFLHIEGVRTPEKCGDACFDGVFNGVSIQPIPDDGGITASSTRRA